jgi:hypothetical protein
VSVEHVPAVKALEKPVQVDGLVEAHHHPKPGVDVIKLFSFVTYEWLELTIVSAPGRPFQPCLLLAGKARSLSKSGVL